MREQVGALAAKCRERNILFDYRPKVHEPLMDSYYTPGTKLNGRCLYPFLHARVSFSGKMYFCPFIRVEVGDLARELARRDLERREVRRDAPSLLEHEIFPVCRRCCKVELSPEPAVATADLVKRRAIPLTVVHGLMLGQRTLLVNPPLVNGVAFTRQGRCQEREEVLGTTKPPYTLALIGRAAARRAVRDPARRSDRGAPDGRRT